VGEGQLGKIIMALQEAISGAIKWILHSGIQNISEDKKKHGGFNSWFDLDKKNYKYIYSEITGYGKTTLSFLYDRTGDSLFLERAVLAGEWLLDNAFHELGGVRTRYYLDDDKEAADYSFESGQLYTFDSGMALFGLLSLYKFSKDKRFLDGAIKIGKFLVDKCQKPDGSLFAYYDSARGLVSEYKKWSTQSGSFHAKTAMGLSLLYEMSGDIKYLKSAESLCDAALKFQEKDGRFVTFFEGGGTHLHPHLYSCEGLLFVGRKLNNEKYISAAVSGIIWALSNVKDGGILNYLFMGGSFNLYERTDALSQLLRLSSFCLQKGLIGDDYQEKIKSLASRLLNFQEKESGGFYYGFHDNGEKLNHINSWCTMFALQALCYYDDLLNNKDIAIDYLI